MKKLLLFTLLSFALISQAQKVSYSYYFNDPQKINPTKIYLDILTLDGGGLGAGLHGYFKPVKNIFVNGMFRYNYLSIANSGEKLSTNELKSGFHGEASAQYQFAGNIKKKEKRTGIKVGAKTSLRIKAKVHKSYHVKVGAMLYRHAIQATEDIPFVSNGVNIYNNDKGIFSNQTGTCFFVGYTGKKVRKVGVDIDMYGKRRTFLARTFFIDAIIGGTVLSDVTVNNINYNINDTKRDAVGYRMGWELEENGTDVRFEMGKKPGVLLIKDVPFNYVLINFGFRIYGKEKFIF
ncbi:MAG: hypothetical protein HUU47_05900 [Bacteroidetes bacterium]|nr:hypothetical protein [Bacteroidota bacterium]